MSDNYHVNEYGEVEGIKVDTTIMKCDGCGANMVFDPQAQKLYCAHCGSTKEISGEYTEEINIAYALSGEGGAWQAKEACVFRCDNCGAKVVLAGGETANSCPFCGTAHVTKSDELAGLKPNALLPFLFNSDNAIGFSKKWAKKKLFAPSKFKKKMGIDNVKGVYTPCFTFDSLTTSTYYGRVGKRHTRTVGSGKNKRVETYIVWRNISGNYNGRFDDVLVTAGSKFDQEKLDKISPYSTNDGKLFNEAYMLGFMAYRYDYEIQDCWDYAKGRIDESIKRGILSQYVYDVVDYLNVSTEHSNVTYKYVMLPVYIGNFNYKKKLYNFYVNGCSGKVTGKTPVSPWRVLTAVLLGCALVAGIALLAAFCL